MVGRLPVIFQDGFLIDDRMTVAASAGNYSTAARDPERGGPLGRMGLRLQRALGRRFVLRLDAYAGDESATGGFSGARGEVMLKF